MLFATILGHELLSIERELGMLDGPLCLFFVFARTIAFDMEYTGILEQGSVERNSFLGLAALLSDEQ